jgi:hypothetical protein
VGTGGYIAPEVFYKKGYDLKVQVEVEVQQCE